MILGTLLDELERQNKNAVQQRSVSAVVWVLPPLLNVYKNLGIYKDECTNTKNADNIVILTLDSTGQSANTMNAEFRDSLDEVTQKLKAETELSGVIFRSAKNFLCWW